MSFEIDCRNCTWRFDPNEHAPARLSQIGFGAAAGLYRGGSKGIELGPYGALGGAGAGAVIGGGTVALGEKRVVTCPRCKTRRIVARDGRRD